MKNGQIIGKVMHHFNFLTKTSSRFIMLIFLASFSFACSSIHLSSSERKLIKESNENIAMCVTLVTEPADSLILRKESQPIKDPTNKLVKHLAKRMHATVNHPDQKGVGIAAPQVGINRRLILVQRFDKAEKPFEAIINPEITAHSDSLHSLTEGCLSIPVIREEVSRPWSITVKYQDTTGKTITESVSGYTARIFQHEIDHLNGVLFNDRTAAH